MKGEDMTGHGHEARLAATLFALLLVPVQPLRTARPVTVDALALRLARARGIALQVGTTNGGNHGSTFVPYGVVDVALGRPLRYSHSPAELVDLKDVASLGDLVRAVAEDW